MNEPKDKIGQTVLVGSFIAYGHALGSCAGLRIGRVLALTPHTAGPYQHSPPSWKASVIGIDDDWAHRPMKICERAGTLFFPCRWLVLAPATVPETYRAALDAFVWPMPKKKAGARGP